MTAVAYNLNHVQVAPKTATPTYVDLKYAIMLDASISQDSEVLSADGAKVAPAYSAPEGDGSLSFGWIDPVTMAIMTGGTSSSSGVAPNTIGRLEIKGDSTPPAVIIVGWMRNIDGNASSAGIRVILPNAYISVPSGGFEQETYANREADLRFAADANNNMIIYEFPVSAPVFTSGVITANIAPPA